MVVTLALLPFWFGVCRVTAQVAPPSATARPPVAEKDADSPDGRLPQAPTASINAWAVFAPETSIRVRTTTTTHSDGKTLANTTEKLLILESVDETGYILKRLEALELGGKRFGANPRRKRYDFLQQPVIEGQKIQDAPPTEVAVGMYLVPCFVRVYTSESDAWRQRTVVWYSLSVYPYLLRSETVRTTVPTAGEPTEKIMSSTVMEVTDTAALHGFRRARFQTYTMQTTRRTGDTTTVCQANCSLRIPGGIVSETIRETDRTGRLIRQIDAQVVPPENRPSYESEPVLLPGRRPRFYLSPPYDPQQLPKAD